MAVDVKKERFFPAFVELIERTGNLQFLLAVQRSLALTLPLILTGALVLMFKDFPLPLLQQWLDATLGTDWRVVCENIIAGTFRIASLAVLCAFGGVRTALHNQRHTDQLVSPTMGVVIVLACFFIFAGSEATNFSLDRGLLAALCIAAVACKMYLCLARVKGLRLPLGMAGNDPVIRDVMTVLPAGILTILFFAVGRFFLMKFSGSDVQSLFGNFVALPFVGASENDLAVGLTYSSLSQLFWFFGAHGPNLLFSVEENLLIPAGLANAAAVAAGENPTFIFTKPFFDAFTRMGGSGCTVCLIVAIFLKSKDGGTRKLGYFVLLPALCNVNEPLLFGLPLVLNPIYLLPFVLTPVLQTLTAYIATAQGWIPHTVGQSAWTMPALLSGYLATDSLAGALMQLFNLGCGTIIYLPFVMLADRISQRRGKGAVQALLQAAESHNPGPTGRRCIDRPGDEGRMAKALAHDMRSALERNNQFFLVYQPQINAIENRIHGVEALLRWSHPAYGMIPPSIIIALAEDIECIDRLGLSILEEACRRRVAWQGTVDDDLVMSVNIAPQQLLHRQFSENVFEILRKTGLAPHLLELEITEATTLEPAVFTVSQLHKLREKGIRVAIDDFGMGHTSLRYLREFPVDTVKIDRSLTITCREGANELIVQSIVELTRSLNIMTVVEGVDDQGQLDHFLHLGCSIFQGYLFSKPLAAEDCQQFFKAYEAR